MKRWLKILLGVAASVSIASLFVIGSTKVDPGSLGAVYKFNPFTNKLDKVTTSSDFISDFLYKPGISGGQTAYGGTSSTDSLVFYSNTFKDGYIKLGDYSAYDENNYRLGIGTSTPTQTLDIRNGNFAFTPIQAPIAPSVILAAGAGNVDNGDHYYKVTYTNSEGETLFSNASNVLTIVDKTINGKSTVTIPVGTVKGITGRKLYRTKAGGTTYFLLATIPNNTATTYSDNTADSSLTTVNPESTYLKENTSSNRLYRDTNRYGLWGMYNMGQGLNVFNSLTYGFYNVAFGNSVMDHLNTVSYNIGLGANAGTAITSGFHNMCIGTYAGYNITTGQQNVNVGTFSGAGIIDQNNNVNVGMSAGRYNNESNNTFIGFSSGFLPANIIANASLTDKNSVYIGAYSGNAGTSTLTNAMALGYYATVGASNTMAIGGVGTNAMSVVIGATTAKATLDVRGSFATAVVKKTGDYTLTANDHTVVFTADATASLPAATGSGIIYVIKAIGSSVSVIIDANGSETIDGELTQTLYDGDAAQVQDVATGEWYII